MGIICPPPLIEIGLTDLPKSGGAMAPLAPPGTTPLVLMSNPNQFARLGNGLDFRVELRQVRVGPQDPNLGQVGLGWLLR